MGRTCYRDGEVPGSVLVPLEVTIEVTPKRDIGETDACEEPSSSR